MSERDPIEIRLDLARGHWALGERAEAVAALERVPTGAQGYGRLAECVAALIAEALADRDERVAERLSALRERLAELLPATDASVGGSPLATSTMAELLAEQGHPDRALEVAEAVLRRNPADARAQAVCDQLGRLESEAAPQAPAAPTAQQLAAPAAPAAPGDALDPRRAARLRAHVARLEGWLTQLRRRRQGEAPA